MDAAVVERDRDLHAATVARDLEWPSMDAERGSASSGSSSASTRSAPRPPAKSGHPTSGMSAADLMAVLRRATTSATTSTARSDPTNDRLIFSKGHASTLLYAIFRAAGAITDEELLHATGSSTASSRGTRRRGSRGSTSPPARSGRACRSGSEWRSRRSGSTGCPSRVWVLCGDSEMAEGSMWEAFEHARALRARQPHRDHRRQPARPARRDDGRLGPRRLRRTRGGRSAGTRSRSTATTSRRSTARTPRPSETTGKPTVIVARTIKGKGVTAVENKNGLARQGARRPGRRRSRSSAACATSSVDVAKPEPASRAPIPASGRSSCRGTSSARRSRRARRTARRSPRSAPRAATWSRSTARSRNSTFAEIFAKAHPERYFEMYIAEQQMVAAAVGMQARGWKPFASTFAAFFSRAYDFIRMAAISRANLCLVRLARRHLDRRGRSLADGARGHRVAARHPRLSTVLHPCDANQTAKLVARDGRHRGNRLPAHAAPEHARDLRRRTRTSRSAAAA